MNFQKTSSRLFSKLTMILAFSVLTACGGGGGGSSITYTGSKSPAVISTTNAKTLVVGAVDGSESGVILGLKSEGQDNQSSPTILDMSKILSDSVNQIDSSDTLTARAAKTVNDSGSSGCFSYNFNIDDVTGSFNGTFTYSSCTEGGTTISGTMNVSGTIELSTSLITQITFSTNSLTVSSGSESFTMAGTISMSVSGSSFTMTVDFLLQNNATNIVVWLENVSFTATDNFSYLEFSISGRFYHPDHGYVDIVTNLPIRINYSDLNPYDGQITVNGAVGSSARMTMTSNTHYTLEIDEDGDSIYETTTTENW